MSSLSCRLISGKLGRSFYRWSPRVETRETFELGTTRLSPRDSKSGCDLHRTHTRVLEHRVHCTVTSDRRMLISSSNNSVIASAIVRLLLLLCKFSKFGLLEFYLRATDLR